MASIFKKKGRGSYFVAYFNADGRRQIRSCKTTDRAAASRIAKKIEADIALRREGVIDATLDRLAVESRRPTAEHLTDFSTELAARGVTEKHREQTKSHIERLLKKAGITALSELSPYAIQAAIGKLRGENRSVGTCNSALRAIKAFSRWLHHDGRLPADLLASLRTKSVDADRTYTRREFSADELEQLVLTTEKGPAILGMGSVDRAMCYRVAAGSGLRANELRSLTPESFNLNADPPTIIVKAGYSKRRQNDLQPISNGLSELLSPWLEKKSAGSSVFALPDKTAKMLHRDLKAARQAWLNEAKTEAAKSYREKSDFLKPLDSNGDVIDFHSFRHGYISSIVNSGASVKVAQELARHSTPVLTIGRYAHARLNDLCGAIESLRIPGADKHPDGERMRATGSLNSLPLRGKSGVQRKRQQSERFSQLQSAAGCESETMCHAVAVASQAAMNATVNDGLRTAASSCETAPGGIRTPDRRIRNPMLYPAELRARARGRLSDLAPQGQRRG